MNKIINQGPQKNLASSIVAEQEKTCICLQAAQTQGRWVNLWNHLKGQRETGEINTHRQPDFCCHCQACLLSDTWLGFCPAGTWLSCCVGRAIPPSDSFLESFGLTAAVSASSRI